MREIKWHVFSEGGEPLCFNDKAIEFDTKEEAELFIAPIIDELTIAGCPPNIKEGILYYDGGYCHYPEEVIIGYDATKEYE